MPGPHKFSLGYADPPVRKRRRKQPKGRNLARVTRTARRGGLAQSWREPRLTLREARQMGIDRGEGAADWVWDYDSPMDRLWREHEKDDFIALVFEMDEVARELYDDHPTYELQRARDVDRAWEEYEAGIDIGARRAWRRLRT